MVAVFIDSSALVRRYFTAETDSHRVRAICAPASRNTLFVSQITPVEVSSAFQRKRREGAFTASEIRRMWRQFRVHRQWEYRAVELTDASIGRAEELVATYPLAAGDAIQLACAIAASDGLGAHARLQFWTADAQQARAARREGLHVELVAG